MEQRPGAGTPARGGAAGRSAEALEAARDRYGRALGIAPDVLGDARAAASRAALQFDDVQTRTLIELGWKSPRVSHHGFATHGDRVSTFVEIATELGYPAYVGALQANFGTPQELGLFGLVQAVDAAQTEAERQAAEAALQQALQAAKPGIGPDQEWMLVDLDVNGDGVVDGRDLDSLAGSR